MARIGFAYMGTVPIVVKMLLEDLGHAVIVPEVPTAKTLSLGTKYAPEFACMPLKIVLGTYIEVLERGADTIVTTGGVGPCRAGQYAQIQEAILRELGYDFEMIVLEPPRCNILDFLGKIRRLNAARKSWLGVYRDIMKAWHKLKALDEVERLSHWVRPRELRRGTTTSVYRRCLEWLDRARTIEEIDAARERALSALRRVPIDESRDPLKVGIVGEIYVVVEPTANHNIEENLGHMGVQVERSIFMTGWTKENTVRDAEGMSHGEMIKRVASPYLPEMIGGHGQDSIGNTILYAKRGFDGVIQLAPFSCIPEIVARSILPRVSEDYDIPVLTFFLDEHSGEAGMITRLEAFVDLLERRRGARRGSLKAV